MLSMLNTLLTASTDSEEELTKGPIKLKPEDNEV
jgi:hypothetical protein